MTQQSKFTRPDMRLPLAGFASLALLAPLSTAAGKTQDNDNRFNFEHVSCQGQDNEIRVVVTNVREAVGLMVADLYHEDTDDFLKGEGRELQAIFAARGPETKFCLTAPRPGNYAIAIFHDENANQIFDKGAFGIPAEPWGLSRDPKIRFSAPPIDKTLINIPAEGTSIAIKLRKR